MLKFIQRRGIQNHQLYTNHLASDRARLRVHNNVDLLASKLKHVVYAEFNNRVGGNVLSLSAIRSLDRILRSFDAD
jgi:hypothetical protein